MADLDIQRRMRALEETLEQARKADGALTLLPFSPSGGVVAPFSANATPYVAPIWRNVRPALLALGVFVATTNTGANYWTIALNIIYGAGAATLQGSVNTSALTASQWQPLSLASFATPAWTANTDAAVAYLTITKTGTPGDLYLAPALLVL